MCPSDAEPPNRSEHQDHRRPRRMVTAGKALTLLVVLNLAVLVAFAVERRSRSDAEFCSSCHNMTAHVDSYLSSPHMDSAHRQAKVGCKDCHAEYTIVDELQSVVAYVAGDYEEVFHRRRFGDEMCLGCHVSREVQAAKTDHLARNPHRSHYPNMPCGACHLAHDHQVDRCGSCHDNGGQRMTGEPALPRALAPWERFTTPGTVLADGGGEAQGRENHG